MSRRAVALHIEALELVGVPAAQRFAVADAFRRELTRLLAEPAGLERFGSTGAAMQRRPAPVSLPTAPGPQQIGAAAARAVCEQLRQEPRR